MRTIFAGCIMVLPCVCGCDVGEYLTALELLSNDSIVEAGIQIIQNIIAGSSVNVTVDAGNQGNRFGTSAVLIICGGGVGLLWFSWKLAQHHVRKSRSKSRSVD
jgi:hypothetical protein